MPKPLPLRRIRDISFPPPPVLAEPDGLPDRTSLRLNLNESRLPASPRVAEAVARVVGDANTYPDHGCTALGALITRRTGVGADRLSFGNGSAELLVAAAMIAMEPGDEAVFPSPTFPTCAKGVQIAGGSIVNVPVTADGSHDMDAMLVAVTEKTRLFYICAPNNPTGGVVPADDLDRAIADVPTTCLLVIDEAYAEFAAHEGSADVLTALQSRSGPWVVTRSFSKAYALSGLRVGYALCSDTDIQHGLWQLRPNFNVNRVAQAAAVAAMSDTAHLDYILETTIRERQRLAGALTELGCRPFPSGANFLTIEMPVPSADVADALAAERIHVQSLPWPAGNGSLRITIGPAEEMDAVIAAVRRALEAAR